MGEPLGLLISGAGLAGLGMAAKSKPDGINNFLVLEAANAIGGMWRDSFHPQATCSGPRKRSKGVLQSGGISL